MAKPKKLNSMRFLDRHKIEYEVFEFDDAIHSAEGVAEAVDVLSSTVFKTLVVMPDDGASQKPLLVLISAEQTLDLKRLAQITSHKKVRMATHQEAEKLTRLKVGGISALALTNKNWPVYIEQAAVAHEQILISAGQRGINLRVSVQDLVRVLDMTVVEVAS